MSTQRTNEFAIAPFTSCAETTKGILPQICCVVWRSTGAGAISGEGAALSLQDYVKLLRSRWVTVCVTTLVAVLGAVAVTLLTTPLYQASTRLFVSTTASASVSEIYQGNRLSQERVLSYTELLMGETLAQRTIDKLGLDMSAEALRGKRQGECETRYSPDRCRRSLTRHPSGHVTLPTHYPTSSSSWYVNWKLRKAGSGPMLALSSSNARRFPTNR